MKVTLPTLPSSGIHPLHLSSRVVQVPVFPCGCGFRGQLGEKFFLVHNEKVEQKSDHVLLWWAWFQEGKHTHRVLLLGVLEEDVELRGGGGAE